MTTKEIKQPERPFKFLDYYDVNDKDIFFGRTRETEILFNDITTTRLVVLFAKTGTGKTSLINAGVTPRLQKLGYKTVYIRVEEDPIKSIKKALIASELLTKENENMPFDVQLEQIVKSAKKPIILFIDQFEEFFIYILNENPRLANQFMSDVAKVYYNKESGVHFVFSMREEFFIEMDFFRDKIPFIFKEISNLRLKWFEKEQAQEAIVRPLVKFDMIIEKELVDKLVEDLSEGGNKIEPAKIQIVCDTLWKVSKNGKILLDDYIKLGGATNIIDRRFEEEIDQNFSMDEIEFFEKMLPRLTTTKKTKYIIEIDILKIELGIKKITLKKIIKKLKSLNLIKESPFSQGLCIEWTSDYLAERTDYLLKRVRAILLRRKVKEAVKKAELKGRELVNKLEPMKKTWIEPEDEDDLNALYLSKKEFEDNFNEESAELLKMLSQTEAEFLFIVSLEHGKYMRRWFMEALNREVDVWKLIKDRVELGEVKDIQFQNAVKLLCDLSNKQSINLLKSALQRNEVASEIINILRREATEETIKLLADLFKQLDQIKAGMALNIIADAKPGKLALLSNKLFLDIVKKKSKSIISSALASKIDMTFLFKMADKAGIKMWDLILIIEKEGSEDQFTEAIHFITSLETSETIDILESLLIQNKSVSSIENALRTIVESKTCENEIKEKAKSILKNWEKELKINGY